MRKTLRLDGELYRQAEAHAEAQGISVTELVEEAIREQLRRQPTTQSLRRIRLPESTASGGLRPEFTTLEEAVAAAGLIDDQLKAH